MYFINNFVHMQSVFNYSFFLFIFSENSEKYICLFSKYPLYLKYIFHSSLFTKDVQALFQAFFIFCITLLDLLDNQQKEGIFHDVEQSLD